MVRMSEESRTGRVPSDHAAPELPEYAERVLEVAEMIPPGRVMTYGDIAEWLEEGGPRQVGRVMALYGSGVPWWRVVRSDGVLLPGSELRALDRYHAEGTPLREASRAAQGHVPKLDMRRARWDGGEVAGVVDVMNMTDVVHVTHIAPIDDTDDTDAVVPGDGGGSGGKPSGRRRGGGLARGGADGDTAGVARPQAPEAHT
ncbi:cysteine methyltransferase [Streptomyces alfalfae]|uniref:MGMT family protein n=2 Tax=Streptomyces alfalfae TaxID=1642299 RepID=A0A4Q2GFN7_9ACTN|nr:cysteine methyltransferase [Streptomyces fradiae]QQC93960.1 MGMT family protein [Streptomyces alfalfae]QUI36045.1 MGMT family protein [Streptomyces alfalfae]RXX41610.1 cysteine methyltransferase [Streptomyces alfalfae]RZM92631.1 cysteine methyltransferase [Streptomyces alfalfae]